MKTITSLRPEVAGAGFSVFLTSYDPSDLPGGSLDPLGFERGYLFLADKILPGLTNVADRPRYFSVLCAGVSLAEIGMSDPPRLQYQNRLDCLLRFERFWALANVLATHDANGEDFPVAGIRGVTYAAHKAESLVHDSEHRADAEFKLLSRQVPYGVVGIYGAVADGMRFLDRKTFLLTPDLGERLAEGFLEESGIPPSLIKAVRENGDLPLAKLTEWGRRAHISGNLWPIETDYMHDALNRNPVRARMATVLAEHPFEESGDNEMARLRRILPQLASQETNQDLAEAVAAILTYETCYRLVALGFERLLWLCRTAPAGSISPSDIKADNVLSLLCERLPAASLAFGHSLDTGKTTLFRSELHRLEDTRRFLERAAAACDSKESLTRELMLRHDDVQRGKFDRGRRKMPWLELNANHIGLTLTRVGGLDREALTLADISPHPYRLSSADALIAAARPQ